MNALHCHFQAAEPNQLGEKRPISVYWDPAAERIWRWHSDATDWILRNPIERAYSHWAMEHRRGNDPLPFDLALEQEEARCREALPLQNRVFSYVDRGFYSAQIRRLWRFFEQVLVLRQEICDIILGMFERIGNISAFIALPSPAGTPHW